MNPRLRFLQRVLALLLVATAAAIPTTIATAPAARADSAIDGPITRSEILSRAQFWVDQNVPYDMGGQHPDQQGKMYRTDCSGFVAMALHLSWSPNTETLPQYLDQIGWEDLRPGDVVGTLGPGTGGAAGHVVLFTGWANSAHTRFFTMEEMGGAGAIRYERPINYTVGSFVAKPYRYKKVIDGPSARPMSSWESGRVVSMQSADGRLEAFAAGADGVHHAWQTRVNGEWSRWELIGGPKNAELALAPNRDGRLELFALNGQTLDHIWQTAPSAGWSGWAKFGTGGHDLATGSNADGRIEVFASNANGVFHRWQDADGWSEWAGTGSGYNGPANARLALELGSDGRLEVFALNGQNFDHLWQTAANGGWSTWHNFGGGGRDLSTDRNADGRIEVFASGPDGVFHKWQTGASSWSAWEGTGPAGNNGPANAELSTDRSPDGRIEVFAINGSTATHAWQTGPNQAFSGWDGFGTGGTDITTTHNRDGRIEVIATSGSGVFHRWQTSATSWAEWAWLNDAGPGVS